MEAGSALLPGIRLRGVALAVAAHEILDDLTAGLPAVLPHTCWVLGAGPMRQGNVTRGKARPVLCGPGRHDHEVARRIPGCQCLEIRNRARLYCDGFVVPDHCVPMLQAVDE